METSLENLIGTKFYRKKGLTDKDKETQFSVEDCYIDDV